MIPIGGCVPQASAGVSVVAARAAVSGDANAANGTPLTLSEDWVRGDGWAVAGDEMVWTGPDGIAMVGASVAFSSTGARVSPETDLVVDGTVVASGRQAYIRGASGDNRGSTSVTWIGPVTDGTTIALHTFRDTSAAAAPVDLGHLSAVVLLGSP